MSIIIIILQSLLILAFTFSGAGKLAGAKMQVEVFRHLGLPQWFRFVTGLVQLAGVGGLIVGFWVPGLLSLAAFWIACTMLGASLFHLRAKDPANSLVGPLLLLTLALVLAFLNLTDLLTLLG